MPGNLSTFLRGARRTALPADASRRVDDGVEAVPHPWEASRARAAALIRDGAWLAVYVLAAIVVTWPLARDLGTHLANTVFVCAYDLKLIVWTLSWQTHALLQAPSSFFDANIYHPVPRALLYSEPAYGALPLFLPVMLATGNPVLSINLVFIASVALLAWGLHLVVARATASSSAGCIAAATVLTSPWLLRLWAPAAPNYAVLALCPVLIALGAAPAPTRRRAGVLAVLAFLQGAVSPYVAAAVLAPLGVLALWRCLRRPRDAAAWRLALAVLVATALLAALYAPNAWLRSVEPRLLEQSVWSMVKRQPANPLAWVVFDGSMASAVAIPLLMLVAVSCAVRVLGRARTRSAADRLWLHGLLWTVTAWLLTTIGGVRIGGATVPSPLSVLVAIVPGLDPFRDPTRLGTAALPGMAVLAGVAFADASRWLVSALPGRTPRAVHAVLATLMLVACSATGAPPAFWPVAAPWAQALRRALDLGIPQMPIDPFATARALPVESSVDVHLRSIDGPLLVIDVGGIRSPDLVASAASAMLASIGAWYPLLNGYGGYYPAGYQERMRLARRLPDPQALRDLQRSTGVEWILVRGAPDEPRMAPWLALRGRPGSQLLRMVARSDGEMLFAVAPLPETAPGRPGVG